MKPFDFAKAIVPVTTVGRNFVVSLGDEYFKLTLSLSGSAQRADHVALIARQVVARAIAKAQAEAYCHAAAEMDHQSHEFFKQGSVGPSRADFATWCRDQAAKVSCIQLSCIPDDQEKSQEKSP